MHRVLCTQRMDHANTDKADDLFRTSVMLSKSDLRKLKVVEAIEGKGRDEVIRDLIAARVADIDLEKAAA